MSPPAPELRPDPATGRRTPRHGPRHGLVAGLFEAAVLAILWLLFSGHYDAMHLSIGAAAVLLVAVLTGRLVGSRSEVATSDVLLRIHWLRMLLYPLWLFWRIAVANLQVARLILHPRLPIDPVLLSFDCGLERELSVVTLGNSITLTPGTVTLKVHERTILVHALTPESCESILDLSMPRAVARVFDEPDQVDLNPRFARSLDELDPELRQ